jgi:hypothetical protein
VGSAEQPSEQQQQQQQQQQQRLSHSTPHGRPRAASTSAATTVAASGEFREGQARERKGRGGGLQFFEVSGGAREGGGGLLGAWDATGRLYGDDKPTFERFVLVLTLQLVSAHLLCAACTFRTSVVGRSVLSQLGLDWCVLLPL